jgi:hypothetical protein
VTTATGKEPDHEDQQDEEEVELPEDEQNDPRTRHRTPPDDIPVCMLFPVPLQDALKDREKTEKENKGGQDYSEEECGFIECQEEEDGAYRQQDQS